MPANPELPSASITILKRRAQFLKRVRQCFAEAGYWEVETPLLCHDTCVDVWLEPFEVAADSSTCFLQTSPEFAMKRLLCAGAKAIYEITRSFRQGEQGAKHNPEFTIAEWYRAGDNHLDQMEFSEQLVRELWAFSYNLSWHAVEPIESRFERWTFRQAFLEFAGIDPLAASDGQLLSLAESVSNCHLPHSHRDESLNVILAHLVEPQIAKRPAVFLYNYPASQAALAKLSQTDGRVAERFELYLFGSEICNGYHELTDPEELRLRMERQQQLRVEHGLRPLRSESRLLEAMERHGLPACSGVAMGLDRLFMFCTGSSSIDEVIAFPFHRA